MLKDRLDLATTEAEEKLRAKYEKSSESPQTQSEPATIRYIFASREGKPYPGTSLNHLHRDVCAPKVNGKRKALFPADFVMHSLRHTMLTRLGESGVDAFTIMRVAGHSSVIVSQRYIHPAPESVERAFERLQLSSEVADAKSMRRPPATLSATAA